MQGGLHKLLFISHNMYTVSELFYTRNASRRHFTRQAHHMLCHPPPDMLCQPEWTGVAMWLLLARWTYGLGTSYAKGASITQAHTRLYLIMRKSATRCLGILAADPKKFNRPSAVSGGISFPSGPRIPTQMQSTRHTSPINPWVPQAAMAIRPRRIVGRERNSHVFSPRILAVWPTDCAPVRPLMDSLPTRPC